MVELLAAYWAYIAIGLTAACIAYLICRAKMAQRNAVKEVESIKDITRDTKRENEMIRDFSRRIADAPDPLQALIESISRQERRQRREES